MQRLQLVVHGRVQGVGFRFFVSRAARELRLRGTVANRADGTVEVRAEGDRTALERLAAQVGRGPAGARIERVEELWEEGPGTYRGFEIIA